MTNARTTPLPGKSTRASSHASGPPRRTHRTVAAVAATSESRSASTTPGAVSRAGSADHGVRISRPTKGSTRNPSPSMAGTTSTSGTPGPVPRRRAGGRPVRRGDPWSSRTDIPVPPGHGAWKPASASTARPSSESTWSTNASRQLGAASARWGIVDGAGRLRELDTLHQRRRPRPCGTPAPRHLSRTTRPPGHPLQRRGVSSARPCAR